MIASDMLPPSSSLMLAPPSSTTHTIPHSLGRSRSTTETSLPRFNRTSAYLPWFRPLSEHARRVNNEQRAKTYHKRAKIIKRAKHMSRTCVLFCTRRKKNTKKICGRVFFFFCEGAKKKIKKGMQHKDFPGGHPS